MNAELIVLRILHVGGGVLWGGWILAMALFVNPAVAAMGQAGGTFMQALAGKTKLVPIMQVVASLVVLSGWRLLWIVSGGFDAEWVAGVHGMFLLTGGVIGTLMYAYGMLAMRPKAKKIGVIGEAIAKSGMPPSADQQQQMTSLKAEMKQIGTIVGWMMTITVLIMSVARYVY